MSVQTSYGYSTPIGAPGGIVDIAPYAIDTFLNEEDTGVMKFGLGVVYGTDKSRKIKLPDKDSAAADFAGITSNNLHTEFDMEGNIRVAKNQAMGVMRWGRIYGRVVENCVISYGDPVLLIVKGDNAGMFCNSSMTGETTIAVKGRFLSAVDGTTKAAAIELFNQAQA